MKASPLRPADPAPAPAPAGGPRTAFARAAAVGGALALTAVLMLDVQAQPPLSTGSQTAAPAASPKATATPKPVRTAAAKPLWTDLTATQQAALRPLAQHWNSLNEAHKRKWLVLSRNYDKLSRDEQATMHGRMADWAGLSARERAQARLNFAEVKRLAPAEERKAKWEAYQALSEQERRDLAASAAAVPTTAALPVRPVPARKLAPVPETITAGQGHGGPRIQLTPPATQGPLLAPTPPSAEAMVPVPAASPMTPTVVIPAPGTGAPTAASDPAPSAQ